MSANDFSVSSGRNLALPSPARPHVFETKSVTMYGSTGPPVPGVAIIGNHVPRQCGIATFTTDLCNAIVAEYASADLFVVAVNDPQSHYSYPSRVRFELTEADLVSYRAAAQFINSSGVGVVSLQHEYGIFGGKSGRHILHLLEHLSMPVVTTLHTVLREPNVNQLVVLQEIAARSDRLIVMSEHSSRFLQDVFGVSEEKIELIPHGIPNLPFENPAFFRKLASTEGATVLLTCGLLSPNKGLENVISALPQILSRHSDVVYIIAGATHPHVRLVEGDRYLLQLQALARKLGVGEHVIFQNRFLSPQEMASLVCSADIYVTPYRYEAQAVSGTLAYALGGGKAIISTPYWHAVELLSNGRGILVPFEDPAAIAQAAVELLDNDAARHSMGKRAYLHSRPMVWNQVARSYMRTLIRACSNHMQLPRLEIPLQSVRRLAAERCRASVPALSSAPSLGGES
ncbi:MAG: glycosyltransferase family 4 protein [Acidobacteriaceae bacterium]